MSYNDNQRIEKSRHARFTLTGVIASKDPESARRTHDALQKICSTIVDAYRIANEGGKSGGEKRAAIRAVTTLVPELEWLMHFTRQETDFCRFYKDIHAKLHALAETVEKEVKMLKADFVALQEEIEGFPDVFDNLLHLLENMTEFMKHCHAAEVCRVIEIGKNAQNESYNLLHLEVKSNFVTQAQLCTQRCKDFQTATANLVKIQEGANEDLEGRVENVEKLMVTTVPGFILASKDYLLDPDSQVKEAQKHSHGELTACFDEIDKILERIRVKYTNSFDEDATRATANVTPLAKSVQQVIEAVTNFRTMAPDISEPARKVVHEAVPRTTKAALAELENYDPQPEDRQELVRCVKQGRDGPMSDFFQAQESLGALVERVLANHQAFIPSISLDMNLETIDDGPKDLLEAAKALCASMKTLNITLDE